MLQPEPPKKQRLVGEPCRDLQERRLLHAVAEEVFLKRDTASAEKEACSQSLWKCGHFEHAQGGNGRSVPVPHWMVNQQLFIVKLGGLQSAVLVASTLLSMGQWAIGFGECGMAD